MKAFRIVFLALLASPLAAQVVVVAPLSGSDPDRAIGDPYGPCLPDPLRHRGGTGVCIPNPTYHPNFTVGAIHYGTPYAPAQVQAPLAPQPRPLSALELAAARLVAEREREIELGVFGIEQRAATMNQLQIALRAQQEEQAKYRAAWPAWSAHWTLTAPVIAQAAGALRTEVGAGRVDRGCSTWLGWLGDLRVALPPVSDYALQELHQAIYDTRSACMATPKDRATVSAGAEAMVEGVRIASEWAEGRGAYYAEVAR